VRGELGTVFRVPRVDFFGMLELPFAMNPR
jgi:hypothetical protein